jgi:hypothetical protein
MLHVRCLSCSVSPVTNKTTEGKTDASLWSFLSQFISPSEHRVLPHSAQKNTPISSPFAVSFGLHPSLTYDSLATQSASFFKKKKNPALPDFIKRLLPKLSGHPLKALNSLFPSFSDLSYACSCKNVWDPTSFLDLAFTNQFHARSMMSSMSSLRLIWVSNCRFGF